MYLYNDLKRKRFFEGFLCLFLLFSLFLFITAPLLFSAEETVDVYLGVKDEEKVFILDAGHGGEDCGTIGVNGMYEKNLNFEITQQLGRCLSDMGFKVVYTRTRDALLYTEEENIKGLRKIYDLKNRARIVEDYKNAVFISIHMNSFSDARYSGLQVFYGLQDKSSISLAAAIQARVKRDLQPKNQRKIRSGEGIYLMENLSCPAILIECGFLSNAEECQKLCEKEYQKQLCFAILCGIIDLKTED